MSSKIKIIGFLLALLLGVVGKSNAQNLFEKYEERSYAETLDLPLLKLVCKKLKIPVSNVRMDKSHSIEVSPKVVFYAIQYIYKTTEENKLFTTKYLLVDKSKGEVIQHFNDKLDYLVKGAVQAYSNNIIKGKIQLSLNDNGIGIVKEVYSRSSVSLFCIHYYSILKVSDTGISLVLDNYPIYKSNGEKGMWSKNIEQETLEVSISLLKSKTNGLSDLKVNKTFQLIKKIDGKPQKGHGAKKLESTTLKFNGTKYEFVEDNELRFLDW